MEYREQTATYWDRLRDEADQYFLRGRLITELNEYMQGRACRFLDGSFPFENITLFCIRTCSRLCAWNRPREKISLSP